MNRIKLPDEMMPEKKFVENAAKIDDAYKEMYATFCELFSNFNRLEVIELMSMYFTERLALMVGEHINEYDKSILRGVLERHIAEVVFVE